MYNTCRLCLRSGAPFFRKSDQNEKIESKSDHALIHFHQLFLTHGNDCKISLDDVFDQCFITGQLFTEFLHKEIFCNDEEEENEKPHKHPLSDYCRSLFVKRSRNVPFHCHQCGKFYKFFRKGCFQTDRLIGHAASHLKQKLFKCRICNNGRSSIFNIRIHIEKSHGLMARREHFEDSTMTREEELKEMILRCFGFESGLNDGLKRMFTQSRILRVTVPTLQSERRSFVQNLIEKYNCKNKIECRQCSKEFSTEKPGVLLSHAVVHLKKFMYSCKRCKVKATTLRGIRIHLKKVHGINKAKVSEDYENRSDEFHMDILGILKKCYSGDGKNK